MGELKLGPYITLLRKERGLTQIQLAEKLNVTHQAVSKWETGESIPDINILMNLAKLFSVSVDELLAGSKSITPDTVITNTTKQNPYHLLKLILACLMLLSFCFNFVKLTTTVNNIIPGWMGDYTSQNQTVTITLSGFKTLFNSSGGLFLGTFLLFIGTLALIIFSTLIFIEDFDVHTPVSMVNSNSICLINRIICGVSALGAVIVILYFFQAGGFIALLFIISYFAVDYQEMTLHQAL